MERDNGQNVWGKNRKREILKINISTNFESRTTCNLPHNLLSEKSLKGLMLSKRSGTAFFARSPVIIGNRGHPITVKPYQDIWIHEILAATTHKDL